jgi:hypothetical protein
MTSRSTAAEAERARRLILLLAASSERRAACAERIDALAAQVDYGVLEAELEVRRLVPLIGTRLIACASPHLPPAFVEHVRGSHRAARVAGVALELEADEVMERLTRAGVRSVQLKGTALAKQAHGDLGLRRSTDIDLLVAQDQIGTATAVLLAAGYRVPRDAVTRDGLPALHLRFDHDVRVTVELHWRVHWYEREFSRALLEAPGADVTAASLLLFYARDGFLGVRLAADLAAFWDGHRQALPAGCLDRVVVRHPALERALKTAAVVAERVVGVPATAWFTGPVLDRRSRLAARLSNWSETGDRDQLSANMTVVQGLLSPASALPAFGRRQLQAAPDARLPHLGKLGVRWAIAWWHMRRGWWAPVPGD